MAYIELHTHSNFSFLDGASHPKSLVTRAHTLGYPALALTDTNGLRGIIQFIDCCRLIGIRPIVGSEVTLENGSKLLLLVRNKQGYNNLSELLSATFMENDKDVCKVKLSTLQAHTDGLIALSSFECGEISTLLVQNDLYTAKRKAAQYRELFGAENFYLELHNHRLPTHTHRIELLRSLGMPCVATNSVRYADKADRQLQDVLTCINHHTTLDKAGRLLYPNAERYLKSDKAMRSLFAKYPDAIEQTLVIASRCAFEQDYLSTALPDFPVPPGYSSATYLRAMAEQGVIERYGGTPSQEVRNQLEHELAVINKLNLAGYFLIVWDIVRFCRQQGILCQGRGSAANSAVCYVLGITSIDPIKLNLLFERFLSDCRSEPPDIDIDIAHKRREEALQYVYAKYGRSHAALVATVISYRGKLAVREVAKTIGFSEDDCNKLAKRLDRFRDGEDLESRVQQAGYDVKSRRIELLLDLVKRLRKFPRHLSTHVGGMVITKTPLTRTVPLEKARMENRTIIEWDKDDAADAGLVKIDLLGLGQLTCIDIALRLIHEHRGITVDLGDLSYDDPKVFDFICTADTLGVFQIESRAQMSTIPRFKPRTFYDLVIEVALIRPGPIQGDMVHPLLRRRNGEEPVTYLHPDLQPVLERTYGVPLFQEQGMKVVMIASNFSASEADQFRRAMGHKRSHEKMQALYRRIIQGMLDNGYTLDVAKKIFIQLGAFANFGFAESHAASFALLVYVSAWLKLNYPLEFYCSLLNAQPMGFYSTSNIVFEGKRRGFRFLPAMITKSRWDCTIEDGCVRLGLRFIDGLGSTAEKKIQTAWEEAPFTSLADFVKRTGLSQRSLAQIAKAGAFNSVGQSRRDAVWNVTKEVHSQTPLLLENTGQEITFQPMTVAERVRTDFETTGLTTGPHPMRLIRDRLQKRKVFSSADVAITASGKIITVAGMVITQQQPETAKGIIFVTLEDEYGFINLVVKQNYREKYIIALVESHFLQVKGQLERKDKVANIVAYTFTPLNFTETNVPVQSRDFH